MTRFNKHDKKEAIREATAVIEKNNRGKVDHAKKQISTKQPGIRVWGAIDFLQNYCGYGLS